MAELYTTYPLKGLDCAHCAKSIEDSLRSHEGFDSARINFATGTAVIPANRVQQAQHIIEGVDDNVAIVVPDRDDGADRRRMVIRWLLALGAAMGMALGLGFHDRLHATAGSWAEYAVLIPAYLMVGWPVLRSAAKNIRAGQFFEENFLMSLATAGAIAIHELPEAVGVMLFYAVGTALQDMAVGRSRRSIKDLINLRPDFARVIRDGAELTLAPEAVEIGEVVLVKPGERFPLDGVIESGESFVDTSPLTGESVPRRKRTGDEILAGMVNGAGLVTIRVSADFAHGSAAKIMELVEDAASRKAPTERLVTKFAHVYTPAVTALAAAIAFVPPLLVPGASLGEWVYRALILLVISCPCALLVSIPLGYFGGLGGGSRQGILVKGANFLEALTAVDTVVFDKTGTLTEGVFEVTRVDVEPGYSRDDVLRLAAAAEAGSNHPIATSILEAYGNTPPEGRQGHEELPGRGVSVSLDGKQVLAGNDRLLHERDISHDRCDANGTAVFVAADGRLVGTITVSDRIKDGAAAAVASLHRDGVRVAMLTGDDPAVGQIVADELEIDEVRAGLLPDGKVEALEDLERGGKIAFAGDGINDAPVIMRADVGFAMGGLGSDAAVEAADVVIMDDDPRKVARSIDLAKRTRRIIFQNIGMALLIKAVFVAAGAAGSVTMWQAVFADVGVTLLAVFNSLRAMKTPGPR